MSRLGAPFVLDGDAPPCRKPGANLCDVLLELSAKATAETASETLAEKSVALRLAGFLMRAGW